MYIIMGRFINQFLGIVLLSFLFISCENDSYELIPKKDKEIIRVQPEGFPEKAYVGQQNPLTENGVALGKKLFEEGRLSADNLVSCSFCHMQEYAFTHHGHDLSHGVYDQVGMRNTPALQNLVWIKEYFYDGASNNLEMASLVPIHNELEMAETMPSIVKKLENDKAYQQMFLDAFGSTQVTSAGILKALAQYMSVLVSAESKYDLWKKEPIKYPLSSDEVQGYQLFQQKCSSCHSGALFTNQSFINNGLPPNPRINDLGRETVSGDPNDRYKFKVPSLRNVAYIETYMHDGRFRTLESVLRFYNEGMVYSETIDEQLVNDGRIGIPMTAEEQRLIIAFLKTLSDKNFITKH